MRTRLKGILAGASLLALASVPAMAGEGTDGAGNGLTPDSQRTAFYVRSLQTDLMVSALTCGTRAEYNAFVGKFRGVLGKNGTALRAYFRAAYGGGYERQLNAFVTAVANRASSRSAQRRTAFCGAAAEAFATILTLDAAGFQRFAVERENAEASIPASYRADIRVATAE